MRLARTELVAVAQGLVDDIGTLGGFSRLYDTTLKITKIRARQSTRNGAGTLDFRIGLGSFDRFCLLISTIS